MKKRFGTKLQKCLAKSKRVRMARLAKSNNVRPLDKRESTLNIRKGMPKVKCQGFFDTSEYEQEKFPSFFANPS